MASELIATDDLIRDLLVADSALATALGGNKVWADVAPQGTAFPYVILAFLSSPDMDVVGGARVFTQPLYLVKAVTTDHSWAKAGVIANRIDAVLQQASGTVVAQGVEIQSIVRESIIRYTEVPTGTSQIIRHYGGQYRCFCSYV